MKKQAIKKILWIYEYKCPQCGYYHMDAIEVADTDMTALYMGSVFDACNHKLVIAELTEKEIKYGKNVLKERIEKLFSDEEFLAMEADEKCPKCHEKMDMTRAKPLEEYLRGSLDIFVVWLQDGQIEKLT